MVNRRLSRAEWRARRANDEAELSSLGNALESALTRTETKTGPLDVEPIRQRLRAAQGPVWNERDGQFTGSIVAISEFDRHCRRDVPALLAEVERHQRTQVEVCGPMIARQGQTIGELSTALEQTVEGLHREAHSVYTSWRVCADSRCRRASELI